MARTTRWVLPATILGSSLSFIDGSVVNVALPAMQRSLAADFAVMQWVVNGYLLTLAGLLLLGGSAADRFGRRRTFVIGLVAFAAASVACGAAPSAVWLIAARLAQGAAAALLMPASLALISASFRGAARGPAIGTWAAAGAVMTALGPPLGGWLVDHVGWRAIFLINLPIAAVAALLSTKLPADRSWRAAGVLDAGGALLAVSALGSLSYGLIALGAGSRATGTLMAALAAPLIWLFVRTESRAVAPMLPLSLFRNREFSGATVLTLLLYAALSGALVLLPFMLIEVQGLSATNAGAAFLPFSVIMGAGSRYAGGLVPRIGARTPLTIGAMVTAAGFLLLALSAERPSYWTGVLPGLVIVAIGMTLAVTPLTTTVFDAAPEEDSGVAAGINSAAARAGALIAVAALGLALGDTSDSTPARPVVLDGYRRAMLVAAGLAGLSALTAALTIGAGRPQGRRASTR